MRVVGSNMEIRKEVYDRFKKELDNCLVIVKDGELYGTFDDDVILLWNVFPKIPVDSKYEFNAWLVDWVLERLEYFQVGYAIVENEKIVVHKSNENYKEQLKEAKESYCYKKLKDELIDDFWKVIQNSKNYETLKECFDSLLVQE